MSNISNITNMLMIGFDHKDGDRPTLVVGRKEPDGYVDIVNIFKDDEALELYKKLSTPNTIRRIDNAGV